jgi:outer membrane protein assembly factor BamA
MSRRCLLPLSLASLTAFLITSTAGAQQPAAQSDPPAVASEAPPPGAEASAAQDSGDGFVDNAKDWAERTQIVERLNGDIDGWYPRLGGMTRGGGFAIGPGYRTHFGDVLVDLSAGLSIKMYKSADVKVRWFNAFDERVELWTNYRFEDFPQEDFFGTGPLSTLDTRTSYDFDSSEFTVLGLVKPLSWLRAGTAVGYISPETGPGTDENFPSIEQVFTDTDAPGLAAQPNFLHTTFFADVDYRDQRGRPRSGGFYHIALGFWDDRTLEEYDFKRFDANFSQYVPLVASKEHVVLGRLGLSYVNNETGERVPFYYLAYVGGVDTIRSFREFRFKDENALWMTAEYNWSPIKYVSLAAFVDVGKVSADWQDIDLGGLKKGYGFGFRVHTNKQTFARVDFGTGGGEGWQMFLKLGPSF